MSFHFSGDVPSSKDKLNNLHNEDEISLAHACNNLLERPREALLTSRRGRKGGGGGTNTAIPHMVAREYRNTAVKFSQIPKLQLQMEKKSTVSILQIPLSSRNNTFTSVFPNQSASKIIALV